MKKYICTVCEYIYDPEQGDPESGIEPGTAFEDIPEDWKRRFRTVRRLKLKEREFIERKMAGCIDICPVFFLRQYKTLDLYISGNIISNQLNRKKQFW